MNGEYRSTAVASLPLRPKVLRRHDVQEWHRKRAEEVSEIWTAGNHDDHRYVPAHDNGCRQLTEQAVIADGAMIATRFGFAAPIGRKSLSNRQATRSRKSLFTMFQCAHRRHRPQPIVAPR